jgi:hypothetical protein
VGVHLVAVVVVLRVYYQGALGFCLMFLGRPPRCLKGVSGAVLGPSWARPGAPRKGHRSLVIRCFWVFLGPFGVPWWGLVRFIRPSFRPFP